MWVKSRNRLYAQNKDIKVNKLNTMKIKALKVTGLYGYFDKEIQFNEDVTVLVGINGSGKTSILNIIKWMLGPAIPELCTLEFKSIILIFDYFGSENIIECKHDESNFIFFTTQDGHKYEPLIISKIKEPWELKGNSKLKNQTIKFYNDLLINYYNNESFQHISDFKRINVIGTNRNSNLNKNHKINDIFFSEERNSFQSELTPIEESVRKVNSYFIEMNNELSGLENELISNLIYFNFNNFELNLDKNYIFPDESEIQRIKNTFKKYFERLNLNMYSSMNYSIEQYFDFFEKLLIQYKDKKDEDNLILRLYTNQFEKIKEIEVELERFQGMRDNQMQRLNNLIDCINSFFKDSNKVIFCNYLATLAR
jgi:predicted ATP-dependent endonuclease of OLD family